MNQQNIEALFEVLGVHNATLKGEWVRGSCPLAFARHRGGKDRDPSFAIRHNPTGRSGYNCFSCNLHGKSLDGLLMELLHELKKPNAPQIDLAKAYALIEEENAQGYSDSNWTGKVNVMLSNYEPWPDWFLHGLKPVIEVPRATAYLNGRGVTPKTAAALEVCYDAQRDMVCFPMRDSNLHLGGLRGRAIKDDDEEGLRYYDYRHQGHSNTGHLWMGESHINYLKPVVIVEGMFDYATVYRVYRNVMANLTTGLSVPKLKKLESAVEVLELFDNDVAGRMAALNLKSELKTLVRTVEYDTDADTDPSKIGLKRVAKMLSKYVKLDNLID